MSKLTYRDVSLLQSAGAKLTFSRTAWWIKDKDGTDWYVTEPYDNQYLQFQQTAGTYMSTPESMDRERFEELFNA
jgi:hypothetical protein